MSQVSGRASPSPVKARAARSDLKDWSSGRESNPLIIALQGYRVPISPPLRNNHSISGLGCKSLVTIQLTVIEIWLEEILPPARISTSQER
jgi:hypothetical protein